MDEPALIKQAQKGDVTAFNRLVMHYQEAVYNVAYRIMGGPQAAEDMTQDAFISAYKSLNRFRGGNFKSWLMRIVTNRCYDELRKHKRRPQSSLDEITEENESPAFLRSPNEGPESQRQRVELAQAIEDCLDALPDDQRITAVLCDVEGYDYKEIAQITSSTLGTVKSRISRARGKLRDCLQSAAELLPTAYRLGSEGAT
ncbi:MAG: sigma-70 family RNA polymerase sigma factor [Chloroflexi bacterium]|nr:sigma-70 family RNA polymerase sigma factor [Chloroflexota bacterium]